MADVKIRYFVAKPNRDGSARHYWQPSKALEEKGWGTLALADDRATAIAQAEARNAALDAWRKEGGDVERVAAGSLRAMIRDYKDSDEFAQLAPATRKWYRDFLDLIDEWAGQDPVSSFTPKDFTDWYKALCWKPKVKGKPRELNTPAKASAVIRTARALWKWGIANDYAKQENNPPAAVSVTEYRGAPVMWTSAAIAHFVRCADAMGYASMGDAVFLNSWLGQRKSDVFKFSKARYRGGGLFVRQGKTDARVRLPIDAAPVLTQRLDAALRRHAENTVTATTLIVFEDTGAPYTASEQRRIFDAVRKVAADGSAERGIDGIPLFTLDENIALADAPDDEQINVKTIELDFQHLRHWAVTALAGAGCTEPEIAGVTGHSLAAVHQILQRYLVRTAIQAVHAFEKRVAAEAKPGLGHNSGATDGK